MGRVDARDRFPRLARARPRVGVRSGWGHVVGGPRDRRWVRGRDRCRRDGSRRWRVGVDVGEAGEIGLAPEAGARRGGRGGRGMDWRGSRVALGLRSALVLGRLPGVHGAGPLGVRTPAWLSAMTRRPRRNRMGGPRPCGRRPGTSEDCDHRCEQPCEHRQSHDGCLGR